jgi:hypothetical protein
LKDVSGVLPGAKNCHEFLHANGHDVTMPKKGIIPKFFRQGGAHILKIIYQKVP